MAADRKGCFVVLLTREFALRSHSGHLDGFDMAAAHTCTHGTPGSRVPHGEIHPTRGAQPIGRC